MKAGIKEGVLDERFESRELALAWYGLINVYVLGQVFQPEVSYTAKSARNVVELFFSGADARRRKKGAGALAAA